LADKKGKSDAPKIRLIPTIIGSARFGLSLLRGDAARILYMCVAAIIVRVALPFLMIYIPKAILDLVAANSTVAAFIARVVPLVALSIALNYLKGVSDSLVNNAVGTTSIGKVLNKQIVKSVEMDYELMEDPDFKKAYDKADKASYGNHAPAMNLPRMLVELLTNLIGFALYAFVIVSVNPVILPLLIAASVANILMLNRARKYSERTRDERSKLSKRVGALYDAVMDADSAKDIRLYGAFDWLMPLYKKAFKEHQSASRMIDTKHAQTQLVDALMILLRDGAAYAYLIYLAVNGQITLGDFVYVFAAIAAMGGWVAGLLTAVSDISKASVEMSDILTIFNYPDRMNAGAGVPLPLKGAAPSIELRNVTYKYPSAEKPALDGVNFTIKGGERLAVVGANGAGKTTLVKLICGLYLPTEGDVLVDGKSVHEYNKYEYYTLFSVVFQDIFMTSASIAGNISQVSDELTDFARVDECLKMTGLITKTATLKDGANSLLVRKVNLDGVELSGGEKQKLAMARALYKDAPILILDEPTAALDPIAENEVYNKYAQLTEGKTSVFISHRLASTRFCDRIILLDGNKIAEVGTHDELMAQGGIYANMFSVQASYYSDTSKKRSDEFSEGETA
jgi:ATP-binding cassette subfamily B protein